MNNINMGFWGFGGLGFWGFGCSGGFFRVLEGFRACWFRVLGVPVVS